jgi:hypothetical protein
MRSDWDYGRRTLIELGTLQQLKAQHGRGIGDETSWRAF